MLTVWMLVVMLFSMVNGRSLLGELPTRIMEEYTFRKSSLDQYKDRINNRILKAVNEFKDNQEVLRNKAQQDLENYINRINNLYSESIETMNKQRETINEINERLQIYSRKRPKQIDASLDEFRRLFNETQIEEFLQWPVQKSKQRGYKNPKVHSLDTYDLHSIWNHLNKKLQSSKVIEIKKTETFVKSILHEFEHFQEDLKSKAKYVEQVSQF